MTALLSMIDK